MIKSYLAEAGLVIGLLYCVGLIPLAGCGGDQTQSNSEREKTTAVSGGNDAALQRTQDRGAATKLLVTLEDRRDKSRIPSARVSVMLQADRNPESISVREIWTDGTGVAEETIEDVYRAAVMSEFCSSPSEVLLSGDLSGDEVSITLAVTTGYRVRGRVFGVGSEPGAATPLERATVMIYGLRRSKENAAAAPPPLPGTMGGFEEFKKRFFNDLAAECRTDGEGRFECGVNGLQSLVVTAHADGYVAADWRHVAMEPADGGGETAKRIHYSPVEINLRPAAQLKIRFLDPRGSAIAGHEVRVRESPFSVHLRQYRERIMVPFSGAAVTDGDGIARFTIPAGMEIVVDSRKPESFMPLFEDDGRMRDLGREKALESVTVPAGQTRSLIAMSQGNVRVECTVVDQEGQSLEGAALSLPRILSRTDAEGRTAVIVVAHKAWGASYRVVKEGYRTAEGVLPSAAGENTRVVALPVELEKSTPLVIDAGRSAQKVWLVKSEGARRSGRVTSGGEDLLLEEVLLPPSGRRGEGWLFDNPGTGADCLIQTGLFSFHGFRCDSAEREVVFDLPEENRGVFVEGRVVLPPGARPQSVTVTLMRNDVAGVRRFDPLGRRGQRVGWASVGARPAGGASASDWSFRFEGVVPGRYALGASLFEWGERIDLYGEFSVEDAKNVAVTLEPQSKSGRLEITVIDRNGQGVVDVDCLLLDPVDAPIAASTAMGAHFVTDTEGLIVMEEMIPGRYGFAISGRPLQGVPVNGRVLIEGETDTRVIVTID